MGARVSFVRFQFVPADLLGKGAKTVSGFTGACFEVFTRLLEKLSVLISCWSEYRTVDGLHQPRAADVRPPG